MTILTFNYGWLGDIKGIAKLKIINWLSLTRVYAIDVHWPLGSVAIKDWLSSCIMVLGDAVLILLFRRLKWQWCWKLCLACRYLGFINSLCQLIDVPPVSSVCICFSKLKPWKSPIVGWVMSWLLMSL